MEAAVAPLELSKALDHLHISVHGGIHAIRITQLERSIQGFNKGRRMQSLMQDNLQLHLWLGNKPVL
jgi:hypothetical protein